jgi:hydroxyacylglutathione hydrolase
MMQVYCLPAFSDNYIFLLHDPARNIAAVVDPAEPRPVMQKLKQLGVELVAIFNTHHHHDHIGANQALAAKFPNLIVYGGEHDRGRIPHQQVFLKAGDLVTFGDRTAEVFFLPGHTHAHIAYYFPSTGNESGELFCGDTLFVGGCGRLHEGTPAEMMHSLDQLRQLPDATRVWCAHEYTLSNFKFAQTIDPNNLILQERIKIARGMRQRGEPTIPTTIGIEKLTNPFMRWDQPAVIAAAGFQETNPEPERVFARIRGKKDLF